MRAVLLLLVACACASTGASPALAGDSLRLLEPLPSMQEFASGKDGPRQVVTAYHIPVGVPEAARIVASESGAVHRRGEPAEEPGRNTPELRIVGGLGSYRGEHPFMAGLVVSLTSGETSVCGGSLVTAARVLTAASCYWDGYSQAHSMLVVLGSVTLFSGGVRVAASSIAVHSSYSPASIHYDIALLTIPSQSTTAYVAPIALTSSGDFSGYRAEVIGFGRTSDSAPITTAASMRDVFVDVISTAQCQQYYGTQVSSAEMCTSGAGGRGPCGGDHGGPLILYSASGADLLLGVFTFSSSAGCAAGAPAGYQRVAYYYSWITNLL